MVPSVPTDAPPFLPPIRYRIPRTILVRLGAEEYLRSFWWVVAPIPIFGAIALATGGPLLRAIGAFAILWPLTIPARGVLALGKTGKRFARGLCLSADEDSLYLWGEDGSRTRLRLARVREVSRRHGYLLVRLRRPGFVAIPESAFADAAHRDRLVALVESAIERRTA